MRSDVDEVKMEDLKLKKKMVPEVIDMGLRDALYILESIGLGTFLYLIVVISSRAQPIF